MVRVRCLDYAIDAGCNYLGALTGFAYAKWRVRAGAG